MFLNCTVIFLSILFCMTVFIGLLLNCVNALTLILMQAIGLCAVCTVCILKKSCGAAVYKLNSNVKYQLCHNEYLSQ